MTTYLPLAPLPQSFGDSLDIMTRCSPAQFFWHLLESSLGESLLAPSQTLLQRADFILARLDKLVDIELAMLERFGRSLGGQRAGIAHFGAGVESWTFVGVWFG